MIKFSIFVAVVALVYSQTTGPGVPDARCPPGTPEPPVHLADPTNCRNFFTCVGGLAFPRECPEGQHWSVNDNFCDWPDRANCEPSNNTCPPGDPFPPVHLPHPTDCTRFFKCSWGVPVEMNCPPPQHWSVQNNWCDWPERANCESGSTTSSPDRNSTTPNSKSSSEES